MAGDWQRSYGEYGRHSSHEQVWRMNFVVDADEEDVLYSLRDVCATALARVPVKVYRSTDAQLSISVLGLPFSCS